MKIKMKYAYSMAAIILSGAMVFQDARSEEAQKIKIEEKNNAKTSEKRKQVVSLIRQAAAYPVTDVAACIGGVKFAASLYADLLSQGALKSEEYTRFSIENQLQFAFENGTPVDIYAFRIIFEMLRINNATKEEVFKNEGKDYADQTAVWEVITCKFNSGMKGFPTGPIEKNTIIKLVDHITDE